LRIKIERCFRQDSNVGRDPGNCIFVAGNANEQKILTIDVLLHNVSQTVYTPKERIFPNIWWSSPISDPMPTFAMQYDAFLVQSPAEGVMYRPTQAGFEDLRETGGDSYFSQPMTRPCQVGSYKPTYGAYPCILCPVNTYQSEQGQSGCLPCQRSADPALDEYCPVGTSTPRSRNSIISIKPTEYQFTVPTKQTTIQQRMVGAVFNPLSSQQASKEFYTLIGTAIGGLFIIITISFFQSRGRLTTYANHFSLEFLLAGHSLIADPSNRVVKYITKLDLFKKPFFHERRRVIIDKGSLTGLFFTLVGALSIIMCFWFIISFYSDFVPMTLVNQDGTPTEISRIGSNNQNSIRFETNEGGQADERPTINSTRELKLMALVELASVYSLSLTNSGEILQLFARFCSIK
jgi:hypothetical protein